MTTAKDSDTRILLVTDDEHEKELASFMLSCGGFNTQIALTQERASMLAAKTRFDVVIIDMASRKFDGVALAQRLALTLDFGLSWLIAMNTPDSGESRDILAGLGCRAFLDASASDQLCSIIRTKACAV